MEIISPIYVLIVHRENIAYQQGQPSMKAVLAAAEEALKSGVDHIQIVKQNQLENIGE